jgi:CubicO group peptidase (beta-lactamase class C family)
MMLARTLSPLLLVLLLPLPAAARQAGDPAARVDAVFARWTGDATPGCAVAVARGEEPPFKRAYGMADLEHGVTNSTGTIFEAGSVSKQFTAAAVVLLAQQGRLSLDDDVRKYVPELPDYGTRITLRHLLTHTSGLRDWGSVAAIGGWGRGARTHTHDHVIDILSRQRALNFIPGAEYSYSNSGYNLLAVIVHRVSGEPFAEFSQRHIFEPLGLRHTQWRDDYTRIVPGRAAAYSTRGAGFVIDRPIEHVHGNGGLLTTVADLLTWNRALAAGALGGETFIREMHRQGVLNDGALIEYAGGLFVTRYNGLPEVSHTGATAGYRAFLARYPEQQLDVAVLCNVSNANPGQLGHAVADVFLPARTAPPPVTRPAPAAAGGVSGQVDLAAAELMSYAGEYYSPDAEAELRVELHGARGLLVMHRRPAQRMDLVPAGPDSFASQLGRIVFIRDAAGRVVQLSVRQDRVYDLRFDRR